MCAQVGVNFRGAVPTHYGKAAGRVFGRRLGGHRLVSDIFNFRIFRNGVPSEAVVQHDECIDMVAQLARHTLVRPASQTVFRSVEG